MLENGNLDVFKEKENITILMETYTMENSKMEKNKVTEDMSFQLDIHMTDNGLMEKCTEEGLLKKDMMKYKDNGVKEIN